MKQLNALANEWEPTKTSQYNLDLRPNGKPRKTKDQRGPRKRRRPKKKGTVICDSSTIDYGKIDRILQNFETNYFEDDNYQNEDDFDDQNEKLERQRWKDWSNWACEVERQRRINILKEIELEEDRERKKRSMWAINAIEKERDYRISSQFLASLCSTQWFEGTVSLFCSDYDLVCPYYKLGCRVSCRRLNLKKHLEDCPYSIEPVSALSNSNEFEFETYEVVCPNSSLGCPYIGIRTDLQHHLLECTFKGMTREEEEEERMILREKVIVLQEEERYRRVVEDKIDKSVLLHNLLHTQLQNVITQLHEEVATFYENVKKNQEKTKERYDSIISKVSASVKSLWPFATVEVFGSYATKLHTSNSDIDLVVCFSDNFQDMINSIGSIPFIKVLANHLEREATDMLRIITVHLYAQVPIIKVSCLNEDIDIPIDISINGHHHSGLASTEMTNTIQHFIQPLSPLIILFKEYLKSKETMACQGGLSSYGLFLLILLLNLKKITAHKVSKEMSSPINTPKQCKKITFNTPNSRYNNKIISHITSYNQLDNVLPVNVDNNLSILFPRLNLSEAAHMNSWNFVERQRQKGKKTALSILGLDDDIDSYDESQTLTTDNSILGILLNEILVVFGEQFQSGRHGFSLRNSGFRFDINQGMGHPTEHPWSNDPLVLEDPLNYLNNVGRNCYKAVQFQRVMADADETLKKIIVRHDSHTQNEMKKNVLLSEIFGKLGDDNKM